MEICHRVLRLSKKLQNRKFDVVERTRTAAKPGAANCTKMKSTRATRAKLPYVIVKYANL